MHAVWFGFTIPPRHRGKNEHTRVHLVKALFSAMRCAQRSSECKNWNIFAVGDLNPSSDIDDLFLRLLHKFGYIDLIDEDIPTHMARRRLDRVIASTPHSLTSGPIVLTYPSRWFDEWPTMHQAQVTNWEKFILGEAPMQDIPAVIPFLGKLNRALSNKPHSRRPHRPQSATRRDTSSSCSCSSHAVENT